MSNKETQISRLLLVGLVGLVTLLSGCRGIVGSASNPTPTPTPTPPPPTADIHSINHIIFMAQENRGFEHYFGSMRQYWAANNIPDQPFNGLPQFNPPFNPALAPTNPGCDPALPPPSDCTEDNNSPAVPSVHLLTMCVENPSPSWNESHMDWNFNHPVSSTPMLDGYVYTAAHDARANQFFDTVGQRAMGYYDGGDLPYYYFMASSFGTSDSWFSPVMTRTQANRMYSLAATSAGHVYALQSGVLNNQTIFDSLQAAGVSWKVYVTDLDPAYKSAPIQDSALNSFATAAKYPQNIVLVSQFFDDLKSGTLPSVAYIEPGYDSGLDEHPSVSDTAPENLQNGAQFVSNLINGLMQSSSWKDSVFILTYDEFGGFYDHMAPQTGATFPSPDGIPPQDLLQGPPPNGPDICTPGAYGNGPNCDFVYSGYRVPLIVVSPFSKKNYVSHTMADYTAWLKLVETRFDLPSLTKRDAAQMDMTEFFDFVNVPWKTPPANIPVQPTNGSCYLDHLP